MANQLTKDDKRIALMQSWETPPVLPKSELFGIIKRA